MENLNKVTKDAWEANAKVWDNRMGYDGNDFFNLLCRTPFAAFLEDETRLKPDPKAGASILDIACGSGLTTRKIVEMGYSATPFNFSTIVARLRLAF